MDKAPVVMIGYSRAWTVKKSLACLSKCADVEKRELFLFLDAPYRLDDVEKCDAMYRAACLVRDEKLPQLQIIRRERNLGVPGNLLCAIGDTIEKFGKVIFFEDDVCVSRTFLSYMDDALDFFRNDKRIFCINGYQSPYVRVPKSYPYSVYFSARNSAWGFGIWEDRWKSVDFSMSDWESFSQDGGNMARLTAAGIDLPQLVKSQLAGEVHTWDVQCSYHMVKHGLYAVEPRYSMTKNIGFGPEGTHCTSYNAAIVHQKFYNYHVDCVDFSKIRVDDALLGILKYGNIDSRWYARIIRKLMRSIWGIGSRHDQAIDVVDK